MKRRRSFGFTLIELMVAMALAGLVVGGALQLHASFGKQTERQNQVAEMQQNLRVSMLILERAIRNAGWGIPGGSLPEYGSGANCTGPARMHYGFEWSNSNTYSDPNVIVNTASMPAGPVDTDPDYFWVIMADSSNNPVYATSDTPASGTLTLTTSTTALEMSPFVTHDLFAILLPNSATTGTSCTNPLDGSKIACSTYYASSTLSHCVREVTGSTTTAPLTLQHASTATTFCFNHAPSGFTDGCLTNVSSTAIRHIPPTQTAYRVMPATDTYNPNGVPKLTYRTAAFNTGYNANWNIISENIDDMQIAVIMNDGRVCSQVNDPSTSGCDITAAVAVRVTLSARSSSKIAGISTDTLLLREDRTTGSPTTDWGYLHRSLTAEIELRNMGADTVAGANP